MCGGRTDGQTDKPLLSVLSTSSTRYHPQPRAPPMGTTSSPLTPPPPKKKKYTKHKQINKASLDLFTQR